MDISSIIQISINIGVSTIIGSIILLILFKLFEEEPDIKHIFIIVFILNVINQFGVLGYIEPYVYAYPLGNTIVFLVPLFLWIIFIKYYASSYSSLSLEHVLIIAAIGYIICTFVLPLISGVIVSSIPISIY